MKTSLTSTTSATIDLSHYFFEGPGFNWQNIAVTLAEWPNPQWADEEHSADITTDTRDLFWLRYKDIKLTFALGQLTTVNWDHAVWGPEHGGVAIPTSIIVPRDPVALLQLLNLTPHPEAQDVMDFWVSLLRFLPFLRAFMGNLAWPDPNLLKNL